MTAGTVYLIGAGPGAADLISVRGRRALQSADAVLIDQLVPRTFLAELEIATTDKLVEWLADKNPRWSQGRINAWLASQARQGRTVARLKGGDPFVFGQADAEIGHLVEWDISYEVIPGPSSVTAALTSAGFPLTRRGQGRTFAVATARTAGGAVPTSFPKADSLVILMGVDVLDQVVAALLAQGWPADAPAAVIERGTLPWERRVESPLSLLAAKARDADISSPACVIVGDAAVRLRACRAQPTVLFTGLDPTHFRTLGNVIHWPALEVVPDAQARYWLRQTCSSGIDDQFDWIVFADRLGIISFFEELHNKGMDVRALTRTHIATVGLVAAHRLGEHGLRPDLMIDAPSMKDPRKRPCDFADSKILVVEGTHASRRLHETIAAPGSRAHHLVLNRVRTHQQLGRALPDHDVIYFVSPSSVHSYFSAYGLAAFQKTVWCLGDDTRGALARYGITATIVSPNREPGAMPDVVRHGRRLFASSNWRRRH